MRVFRILAVYFMFELYVGWVERLFAKPSIRYQFDDEIRDTPKKRGASFYSSYTAKLSS